MSLSPIKVSDDAATHLKSAFEVADKQYVGLLATILENKGCGQGEYKFEPITEDEVKEDYDKIEDNGVTLFVPRTQILFIFGSELVLEKDQFSTRLDFKNPNEEGRCGCGESVVFNIPPKP
jgi:iron-sulfur cluster assembly protein